MTAYRKPDANSAMRGVAVVPSDATVIPPTRMIYVGTTGVLVVHMADEASTATITFTALPVGFHPLQVDKVLSTGTTAANIVALY